MGHGVPVCGSATRMTLVFVPSVSVFLQAEKPEPVSLRVISQANLEAALKEVFALKPEENLEALVAAALAELKPEEGEDQRLKYQDLFLEVLRPFCTRPAVPKSKPTIVGFAAGFDPT